MVIELCVVQFWSEIILVVSNRTSAQRSFDSEITRMISDQIALHSVQSPLWIFCDIYNNQGQDKCHQANKRQRLNNNYYWDIIKLFQISQEPGLIFIVLLWIILEKPMRNTPSHSWIMLKLESMHCPCNLQFSQLHFTVFI